MDRRQFGRVLLALFGARAVTEIAAGTPPPLLLENARTNEFDISPEFDNATWAAHPTRYPTAEEVADGSSLALRRPGTLQITQEMIDDCVVDAVAELRERDRARLLYGTGRDAPRGIVNAKPVAAAEKLADDWRYVVKVHYA